LYLSDISLLFSLTTSRFEPLGMADSEIFRYSLTTNGREAYPRVVTGRFDLRLDFYTFELFSNGQDDLLPLLSILNKPPCINLVLPSDFSIVPSTRH
jgi:hypothetical protein